MPGERLPLIPRLRLKLGASVAIVPKWSVGATLNVVGSSFYRGDEANLNDKLPGYRVVGLHTTFQMDRRAELFVNIQNLFDARYSTFGLYSDPTGVGASGIPRHSDSNDPRVDNRFQSPAMPRAFFGGVRVRF